MQWKLSGSLATSGFSANPLSRSRNELPLPEPFLASIQGRGVIEPIRCVHAHGSRLVISGHRRLRAAKKLGIPAVPALIGPREASSTVLDWLWFQGNLSSTEFDNRPRSPLEKFLLLESISDSLKIEVARIEFPNVAHPQPEMARSFSLHAFARAAFQLPATEAADMLAIAQAREAARIKRDDMRVNAIDRAIEASTAEAMRVVRGKQHVDTVLSATAKAQKIESLQSIPEPLQAAFAEATEFRRISQELRAIGRRIQALALGPAGGLIPLVDVTECVESAAATILDSTPHRVCDACGGQKCEACKFCGFVGKQGF